MLLVARKAFQVCGKIGTRIMQVFYIKTRTTVDEVKKIMEQNGNECVCSSLGGREVYMGLKNRPSLTGRIQIIFDPINQKKHKLRGEDEVTLMYEP